MTKIGMSNTDAEITFLEHTDRLKRYLNRIFLHYLYWFITL